MSRLTDDDVTELIKGQLRIEASAEFTGKVLLKLERSLARRARRRAALAAIGIGALVLFGLIGSRMSGRYERSRAEQRLQTLRSQYREIESELDELRALASEIQPVLDLGGTEQVDFVFDLREVDREELVPRAEPVSHGTRR